MIAAGGLFPRMTILELEIAGVELRALYRTRAALLREMARRAATKLEASLPTNTVPQARRSMLTAEEAAGFERMQLRAKRRHYDRMADALELIADKIEPSITYTVGDDLLERIAGPLSHGGAPYGGEDDDDDEPTPPGNVRAIRKGAS